mgnify:CR=1 FL=1
MGRFQGGCAREKEQERERERERERQSSVKIPSFCCFFFICFLKKEENISLSFSLVSKERTKTHLSKTPPRRILVTDPDGKRRRRRMKKKLKTLSLPLFSLSLSLSFTRALEGKKTLSRPFSLSFLSPLSLSPPLLLARGLRHLGRDLLHPDRPLLDRLRALGGQLRGALLDRRSGVVDGRRALFRARAQRLLGTFDNL